MTYYRSICTFKSIFKIACYQFTETLLILGPSSPPHFAIGVFRLRVDILHLIKKNPIATIGMIGYDIGLLIGVGYWKRSSSQYYNFDPDLYKLFSLI